MPSAETNNWIVCHRLGTRRDDRLLGDSRPTEGAKLRRARYWVDILFRQQESRRAARSRGSAVQGGRDTPPGRVGNASPVLVCSDYKVYLRL